MEQPITGFHRDDLGDWVAELACGHGQHVRHNPPWQNRPWVETREGRVGRLGHCLDCRKCEAGAPPDAPTPHAGAGQPSGGVTDPFDLQRFVRAQDPVIEEVMDELRAGRKRSHWMWFVFPQLGGLGRSPTAVRYALSGAGEARAYLSHPALGERLETCCRLLLALPGGAPEAVFGPVDAMKLRSSMTLFAAVSGQAVFTDVLGKYFGGRADPATLKLLGEPRP